MLKQKRPMNNQIDLEMFHQCNSYIDILPDLLVRKLNRFVQDHQLYTTKQLQAAATADILNNISSVIHGNFEKFPGLK